MQLVVAPFKVLGLLLALALLASCGLPTVRADIEAYQKPNASLQSLHRFGYQDSGREDHALRDQNIYLQVRSLLEQRGLKESAEEDFFITLRSRSEKTTVDYPAYYEMGPHLHGGFYGTAYVRGGDGNLHPSIGFHHRGYHSSPYRIPGRSVPAYEHHLAVDFRSPDGELLWQGTIALVHRSSDLSGLVKLFLPDLLDEFPAPSGASMERWAKLEN